MEDNQINGQKINKKAYCPNSFFNNDTISIGEFKTLDDAMNFPIKEIWCINRTEDNKFQSYKSQGSRLFIICSWNRSTQDPLKFVLALIHKDKVGKLYYWDMNDLPLYPDEKKNQYEGSLGDDATYTLYQIANNQLNCNTYKHMKKKLIRLTESDLHKVIKESVNKVLTELDWKTKMNYVMGRQKQGDEAYRQGDENGARKYWDKAGDGIYDVRDEFEKKYNGRPFRNMKDDKFRMGDINKNTGDIYTSFNHGKCFNNYTSKNGNAPDVYGYDNDYYLDNFEDKNDVDTFRRMNKDVNNYRNGNSKYVKGKGWQ